MLLCGRKPQHSPHACLADAHLTLPCRARPPSTPPQADIRLAPGSHASEAAVNKQLADKERVAAALENPSLLGMVDRCLAGQPGL